MDDSSGQLLLSSDVRLSLHTDLSVSDTRAPCLDMQVVEDFSPYCLVTRGVFLAMVTQSRTSPPRAIEAAL